MSIRFDYRVVALAGLTQALLQVRKIAETGHNDREIVRTAIDSVFRFDADSVCAVYGGCENLHTGFTFLKKYLSQETSDKTIPNLVMAVLQTERHFRTNAAMKALVEKDLLATAHLAQHYGDSAHQDVINALGLIYSNTLSKLHPRIMVQGNPHYLGQADIVALIRALLLSALRSSVLWRQMRGSMWDFVFSKRAMASEVAHYLRA